jgi:hypothetical protein
MRKACLVVIATLCAAVLGAANGVCDGVAVTRGGRLSGRIAFRDDGISVGGKTVRWDDVLFVARGGARRLTAPQAVRFENGEVWTGDILRLSAGKLGVRGPLFGEREVVVGDVAQLAFAAWHSLDGELSPNTLYRKSGEPVPGSLIWIDETHIAMDTPLGVLKLDRDAASRYVVQPVNPARPPKPATDTVFLFDGTVLHGRLAPSNGGLRLEHAKLGTVDVPGAVVRAVLRRPEDVACLAEEAFASVEAAPLVTEAREPERIICQPAVPGEDGDAEWLTALRMWPRTTLSIPVKAPGTLRGRLCLENGSRGSARVRIQAKGKTLLDQALRPGAQAAPLSVAVPGSAQLVVEVDFDGPVRFPCSVLLADPHVIAR